MTTISGMLDSISDISRNIDSYVSRCRTNSAAQLSSVSKELAAAEKNKKLTEEVTALKARQAELVAELSELRANKNDAIAFISRLEEQVATLQADTRQLISEKRS